MSTEYYSIVVLIIWTVIVCICDSYLCDIVSYAKKYANAKTKWLLGKLKQTNVTSSHDNNDRKNDVEIFGISSI